MYNLQTGSRNPHGRQGKTRLRAKRSKTKKKESKEEAAKKKALSHAQGDERNSSSLAGPLRSVSLGINKERF